MIDPDMRQLTQPRLRQVLALLVLAVTAACNDGSSAQDHAVVLPPTDTVPANTSSAAGAGFMAAQRVITVTRVEEVARALAEAQPGDEIRLDNLQLNQALVIAPAQSGTASAPIRLLGVGATTIQGSCLGDGCGYGILVQASYWQLENLHIRTFKKGVMLEGAQHVTLRQLTVSNIGEEGVHFRRFSSDNVLEDSTVQEIGLFTPGVGEGVYIGSAVGHWPELSQGEADRCDRNVVRHNRIQSTRAENIDVKEGTTGTVLEDNQLDGSALSAENSADSLLDIKGNDAFIRRNTLAQGVSAGMIDAIQGHVRVTGWGNGNRYEDNVIMPAIPGYGINVDTAAIGTVIRCNNSAPLAVKGVANRPCDE